VSIRETANTGALRHAAWVASLMAAWTASLGAASCGREPAGRFAQEEPQVQPPADPSALRYGPTLAGARRADETIAVIAEVDQPDHGRVEVLVAVVRNGDQPAIEAWRFRQKTPEEPLEREGDPVPMLRVRREAATATELAALRVRMASPSSAVRRVVGVPGDTPSAVLERLAEAARAATDASANPQARVDALAMVARGLDDGLLVERDELGLALDELAHDRWLAREVQSASDRRATVTTRQGVILEMLRKGDGWVIAGQRKP
jgi:hypothetical protein